jgi:hypothetical protein
MPQIMFKIIQVLKVLSRKKIKALNFLKCVKIIHISTFRLSSAKNSK